MTISIRRLVLELGFLIILCCSLIPNSSCQHGEVEKWMIEEFSSACLKVYNEGGAPAALESPECPRWNLSINDEEATRKLRTCMNKYSFRLQGRRKYQEDRIFCALDLKIPFPAGRTGVKEVVVGIVAVFDGHNGAEASEMASKLLLDYFLLHARFLQNEIYSVALEKSMGTILHKGEQNPISGVLTVVEKYKEHALDLGSFEWMLPEIFDGPFHMEILKESLMRAIHDIDATFSKEAFKNNLTAGATANVVLIVDNQILVSNVGDSKAILCSEKFQSPQEVKETLLKLRQRKRNGDFSAARLYQKYKMAASSDGLKYLLVKELTIDHHPDRDDERSRIESAGGYVEIWGVPRVNGRLAVSRAIGDIPFKRYGVISTPEVTDWQPLTANDTYLVAASDGIFEQMTTQDVCDLLWNVHSPSNEEPELFSSLIDPLAEFIVNTAFQKGSMDNMAAVVVPLKSSESFGSKLYENTQ